MSIFAEKRQILVTCPKFVVPHLKKEIEDAGYKIASTSDTIVEIEGTMYDATRLNLLIRTGHRVLFFYKKFNAITVDDLYDNFYKLEWEELIPKNGYISISSFVEHTEIVHTKFPNLKAKDAIVDRFRNKFGIRPDSGSDRKGVMIYFHWVAGVCSVFIDTSGDPLSKRNYRKIPYKAPMQESLAAAVLLAADWKGEGNFVNPMCGSGTLAIEGALLALNKAPGLLRTRFSFMNIIGFDEKLYKQIREEIKISSKKKIDGRIVATDISPSAIKASIQNAKTAGVDHLIEFKVCDFRQTEIPDGDGIIIFNPEYGERLGDVKQLENIYKGIGDFFKQKGKGYTGYVFSGNFDLIKKIGLRTKRRIPFYNGKIECRLLEYELYQGSKKN